MAALAFTTTCPGGIAGDGVVASIEFTAAANLESCEAPIEIQVVKATGANNSDLAAGTSNGSITINGVLPTLDSSRDVTLSQTSVEVNGTDGGTINATVESKKGTDLTTNAGITWSISAKPGGAGGNDVTIGEHTGVITVDPCAAAGNYTVTATADGTNVLKDGGVDTATATLTVTRAAAAAASVAISGDDTVTIPTGETAATASYAATVRNQYGDTMNDKAVKWSLTGTKTGVSINETTGALSVTKAATAGSVTVKATVDGTSVSNTKSVTLQKIAFTPNEAPTVKGNPVYGDKWSDIVSNYASKYSAKVGETPVEGTYTLADADSYPEAGEQTYQILFTDNETTHVYEDVVAYSGTVTIAPKEVTVGGITVTGKTYNGTTAVASTAIDCSAATFDGMLYGDNLSVSVGTGSAYTDKNAGSGKTVTLGTLTLGGDDAGNYTIKNDSQTTATATITAKEVTVGGIKVTGKTYDGTTAVADSAIDCSKANFTGKVTGDTLTVSVGAGSVYANKNVGSKTVTLGTLTLGGTDAGNYSIKSGSQTTATAAISAKSVTVSGVTAANKVYNGTTAAEANTGSATITDVIGGDTVSLVNGTAAFTDKNVGTNKTVKFSGFSLTGADAGNYALAAQPANTTADITPATILASAISVGNVAVTKTYDGTTAAATPTGTLSVTGVNNETLKLSVSAASTYADKNVGTNKTVTLTLGALSNGSGSSAGTAANYRLDTGLTTYEFTKAAITAAGYTFTVPTPQNVKAGAGLSALQAPAKGTGVNSEEVAGTFGWYTNSGRTTSAKDTDISGLAAGKNKTLYWKFTATDSNYVTAAKQGQITVSVIAADPQNISFANGTSVTKTYGDEAFTNTVAVKTTNNVPVSDGGAITYKSSNTNVATVSSTGEVTIKSAGTATITATAAAVAGQYAQGTASYTLTVNKKSVIASIGTISAQPYTGAQIKPSVTPSFGGVTLSATTDYTISYGTNVNAGTNAGSVTVSPVAGSNYTFTAVTERFDITKATLTAANFTYTAPQNLEYDGNAKTATVVANSGISGIGTITVKYNSNTAKPTAKGEYTVSIDVAEGDNYNAASNLTSSNWKFTITGKQPTAGDLNYTAPSNLTYNGSQKAATVTAKSTGLGTVSVKYAKVTNNVEGSKEATAPTDAGTYKVYADITAGDGYDAKTDLYVNQFTIAKANYDMSGVSFSNDSKTYTGSEQNLAITGALPTGADNIQVTVSYSAGLTDVGSKTITATFATTSTNYNVPDPKTATLTITKAPSSVTTPPAAGAITYGQTLANSTLTGGAGSVAGSFAWTDSTTAPTVSDSGTTTYSVTFTPTNTNYSTSTCTVTLTVNKADYTGVTKTATANLRAAAGSTTVITLPDIPSGASYGTVTNSGDNFFTLSAIAGGKLTATSKGTTKTAAETFTVAVNPDGNHNGYTITVTVTPTYKTVVTINADADGFTYGTTGKKGYKNLSVTGNYVAVDDLLVSYEGVSPTVYGASSSVPTQAGTYKVTFTVPDSNDDYTGTSFKEFTIAQKSVTAAAGDLVVSKAYDGGTTAGTITSGALALSGVIDGDDVTVSGTPGVYASANYGTGINVTITGLTLGGADAGNYVLSATSATFAVGKITKATQAALSFTSGIANKIYGDVAFDVVVGGGSGTGAYSVTSSNTSVLTVAQKDSTTFTVTIVGVGNATLTVSKAGDSNHEAATSVTSATITVSRGTRTITGLADSYDLYPNSTSLTLAPAVSKGSDDVSYTYVSGNPDVVSVGTNGKLTAIGDGTATVTVTAKGDNYENVSKTVTVNCWLTLVTGVSATAGESDTLTASVVGDKIVVSGLKTAGTAVTVIPTLAGAGKFAYSAKSTAIEVSLSGSSTALAVYTVDLSGVTDKVESVTIDVNDPTPDATSTVSGSEAQAAEEAMEDASTKTEGLANSAAVALQDVAKSLTGSAVEAVEVEVEVVMTATELVTTGASVVFTVDITPTYSITRVGGGTLVEYVPVPEDFFTTPVTVSVKLPEGFPSENLVAKHTKDDDTVEWLEVTVENRVASWQQSSFSSVSLVVDTRVAEILFQYDGGNAEVRRYAATDIGSAFPTDSKSGCTFNGWIFKNNRADITGFTTAQKTLTDDLLTALNGKSNLTAEANFKQNGGGGNGGGGGGGAMVTGKTITIGKTVNGTVSSDVKTAIEGDTVTLTVAPNQGFTLETLTVTDNNGKEIAVKNLGNNKFSFAMPESNVTVNATFMEDNTMRGFFADVKATDYYYDAVLWAAQNGVTSGTDATHFSPLASCTRAQTVTFLWRAAGSPEPVSTLNPFVDVDANAYYYKAVLWAVEQGITNGTGATTFDPAATVSRGQVVTFLFRAAKAAAVKAINPFGDVNEADYYSDAVLWAVANGITNGTSDTTFSPSGDCTRGQIVTFLYRHFAK